MKLVEVKENTVYCDSMTVSKKFGQKHAEVIRRIEKLSKDLSELRVVSNHPNIIEDLREYRGQSFKVYMMDRQFFSLLVMRFKGKKALEWQVKFNNAFYAMEERLLKSESNQKSLEWKQQREQGKLARREETDTIQRFVKLAESQGSKSSKWYFKHFTHATYKALQLIESKKPKLRDTLDMLELNQLILAENVAMRSLEENMASGEHYKAIFVNVKNDIEKFASTLFLPKSGKEIK